MVDICSLIDNLFHDNKYDDSLLSHWSSGIKGYKILLKLKNSRNPVLEKQIRDVRNSLGAHLDSNRQVSVVLTEFSSIDLVSVHRYATILVNSFFDACREDLRTKHFSIRRMILSGMVSAQDNSYKPFYI